MSTIDDLVATHLATWNAPAGADRDAAVAATYAPDVAIAEPGTLLAGPEGMAQAIDGLQAMAPGAALERTGAIQTVADLTTYTWALATAGQPAVATGRDVLLVRDGRIASLYVVIDLP